MPAEKPADRPQVATVFRCTGCRHKSTYGVDYLDQVGPLPENCPQCGGPWTGKPVYADPPTEDQ